MEIKCKTLQQQDKIYTTIISCPEKIVNKNLKSIQNDWTSYAMKKKIKKPTIHTKITLIKIRGRSQDIKHK